MFYLNVHGAVIIRFLYIMIMTLISAKTVTLTLISYYYSHLKIQLES